ncbi:hypothetical protein AbraIFM66951_009321 [Aspergillus brasiliensis]|nr:hypothetical protein AbraIFM66951_009321 [Aspergillus brasiliensis]
MVTTRKMKQKEEGKGPALYPNAEYLCQREEYHDIMKHHLNMGMLTRPHIRSAPEIIRNGFDRLAVRVRGWAMSWGEAQPMYRLSIDDKRAIIASLDGFCVQDDWDSIYSSLPPGGRAEIGIVLLEALLNKFIYEKFASSTFWFMDAKIDATDQEGDANFYKRFDYVYERFKESKLRDPFDLPSSLPLSFLSPRCLSRTSLTFTLSLFPLVALPQDAAWWKSILVSVCTLSPTAWGHNTAPPTKLYHPTLERSKVLLKAYGDELLASRPFQLLCQGPLSEEMQALREERTRQVLNTAAHEFMSLQGQFFGNLVVERLPELPTFDRHLKNMNSHILHIGFKPHHGARVLIVTSPHYSYHNIIKPNGWGSRPPLQIIPAQVLTAPKGPKARAQWAAGNTNPKPYLQRRLIGTTHNEGVGQEEDDEEGSEGEERPRKLRKTYLRGAEDE